MPPYKISARMQKVIMGNQRLPWARGYTGHWIQVYYTIYCTIFMFFKHFVCVFNKIYTER